MSCLWLVSTNCYVPYLFTAIIQFVIINSPAAFSLRSLSFVNDSCKKVLFECWGKIKIFATASFAVFVVSRGKMISAGSTRPGTRKNLKCVIFWPREAGAGTRATLINARSQGESLWCRKHITGHPGYKGWKYEWVLESNWKQFVFSILVNSLVGNNLRSDHSVLLLVSSLHPPPVLFSRSWRLYLTSSAWLC